MKTLFTLVMALLFAASTPLALAQDKDQGTPPGSGSGEKKEGEKDVFTAPDAAKNQPAETAPVAPQVAEPEKYPVNEIDRPYALPRMMLEPKVAFQFERWSIHAGNTWDGRNQVAFDLGARFGIIKNLEAGMSLPIIFVNFDSQFDGGPWKLWGLYEIGNFLDNKLRVAGKLTMGIPFHKDYAPNPRGSVFSLLAEGNAKYKFNNMFGIYTNLGLGFQAGIGDYPWSAFLWKFELGPMIVPIEPLYFTLLIGIDAAAPSDHNFMGQGDTALIVPLLMRGQYTVIAALDLFVDIGFLNLAKGADYFFMQVGAAYRFQF